MHTFIFKTDPTPFSRPARNSYLLQKDIDFREYLAIVGNRQMKLQRLPIFDTPMEVNINLYRKRKPTDPRFGDIDNHLKNILDALNGVIWKDDRLILNLCCTKNFSDNPKIIIDVEAIT